MKKLTLILSLMIVSICVFLMNGCLGGGNPPPTFSVSGFVREGEIGIEGVKLVSDVGTTTTDENGFYSFDGLLSGITITAEMENYCFVKQTQTFFDKTGFCP